MQEVDIVYLYEKAVRELDVACAIKHQAWQRHGLRVEIVQQNYGYARAFAEFCPRVVVLPFCYQERSNNFIFTEWRKAAFFNLTWEQLFYPGNQAAKTPRGEFAVKHVIHHAWSDFYADLLRRQGVPQPHIFVNGNPAYALYDEPYRRYFKQRDGLASEYGLDPAKPWVFFPENYNWAFYDDAMLQQMVRDGQPAEQVSAMRDFSRQSFEAVIRWCAALADRPGLELIVRPRPATVLQDFVERVRQIISSTPSRMHIIQKETVREWIIASDAVVSSYSTSLIEASIAGKPIYMLEPYPIPASLQVEWHALVPRLKTQADFLQACSNPAGTGRDCQLANWARSTMMAHGDAIWNIADYLARLCRGEIQPPPIPSRKSVTLPGRLPLPPWLLFEYRRIRWKGHRRTPPGKIHPEYAKDVVGQDEIEQRVSRWNQVLAGYSGK
jgi:surface carbohydrate biosynthesis protein